MCAQEQGLWAFTTTTETAEMLGLSVKLGPLSRKPKKGQYTTLCTHEKCVTACIVMGVCVCFCVYFACGRDVSRLEWL